MGKRVSISQPAVIQTELRPLDESFWVDGNSQLEQWYYQNTGVFAPDRQITPLTLTPKLSLLDPDTNTSYTTEASPATVTFQSVDWKVKEWNGSAWVETTISSVSPSDPYYTSGDNLVIRKNNYDAAHAINITCRANYRDPRDVGTTCWLETSIMLVTNMDATQVFPNIDIKNPSARMFNPLKDDNPIFEFEGACDWDVLEGQGGTVITEYKADALGTEKILPANEDGIVNAAPLLEVKYGDTKLENQQFMDRQTSGGVISEISDGVAKITNIKGDTVKINQTIGDVTSVNAASGSSTRTYSGGVMTVTISSVSTGTDNRLYFSSFYPPVVGHKYIWGFYAKGDSVISLSLGYNASSMPDVALKSSYQRLSQLITRIEGTTPLFFDIHTSSSSGGSFQVANRYYIDLTEMFGSGNEPASVEAFDAWVATHIGHLDTNPIAGKLINYGGYSVKWNQMSLFETAPAAYLQNNVAGHTITTDHTNHTITCSVTAAKSGAYIGAGSTTATRLMGSFDSTHKYYFKFKVISKTVTANKVFVGGQSTASQTDYIGTTYHGIIYKPDTNQIWLGFYGDASVGQNWVIDDRVMIFDLTLMFGSGNEPDLDWCNKYLSRDYYDYCAGQDRNIMDIMELKTFGFNLWDEQLQQGYWSSIVGQVPTLASHPGRICGTNPIEVEENTLYNFKCHYVNNNNYWGFQIHFLDKDKKFIVGTGWLNPSSQVNLIYTPFGCRYALLGTFFIRENGVQLENISPSMYNHDMCFNLSDPQNDGKYVPHSPEPQYQTLPMGVKTQGFNAWNEQWLNGTVDNSGNVTYGSAAYFRSKSMIPVLPNTAYYFKSNVNIYVYEYDKSGNAIGWLNSSNNNECKGLTLTTKANTAYFMFMAEASSYVAGGICINISDTSRKDDQDVWGQQWVAGAYSASNGNFDDTATTSLSSKGKIDVLPSRTYLLWLTSSKGGNRIVCFYNSSNTFISAQTLSAANSVMFTTPATAAYMTFTIVNYGSAGYTYANDITLNLSKNGTYEAHWESFSDMSWITKIGIENFNIWDEEWEVGGYASADGSKTTNNVTIRSANFIPVKASGKYFFTFPQGGWVLCYNSSKTLITSVDENRNYFTVSNSREITLPSNCTYVVFQLTEAYGTTYKNNVCINESINAYNEKYLPHGETMKYFPSGVCNIGSSYDEVKIEGGKIKGVSKFFCIDLGDLPWTYSSTELRFVGYTNNILEIIKKPASELTMGSIVSSLYTPIENQNNNGRTNNMRISIGGGGGIVCTNTSYTDTNTFAAAMKGVKAIFELATPYEFEIDYPTKGQFEWYGINGSGQEVPIDQLPVYSQATQPSGYGQHTSKININAMYALKIPTKRMINGVLTTVMSDEEIPVILMVKRYPWSAQAYPVKVTKTVAWRIPSLDVIVTCDKGTAVRETHVQQGNVANFIFSTIINQQGEIISDAKKQEHMVFDWYHAVMPTDGSAATVVSDGSGLTKSIPATTLQNLTPANGIKNSTNVWCEAFILGPYHLVNGTYIRTKDNN